LAYKVTYKESVEKDLKDIDKKQVKRILDAIRGDLAKEPRKKGEPLHGDGKGYWKYYVRPYRVIYEIFDREDTIRIDRIGHRKDVYR
jgi:mRNA interferase RelE/StbE